MYLPCEASVCYNTNMNAGTFPRGSVHVVTTRRQGRHREYVAHLLMHSYREDGKVKKETVANLSHLPDDCIELIRGYLAGEQYVKARDQTPGTAATARSQARQRA